MTTPTHAPLSDSKNIIEGSDVEHGRPDGGETAENKVDQYELEKNLVRRQDLIILPQMAILYLVAYLDRSNFGNAKLQGLVEDALEGNDNYYNWAASIFYFGYVSFAVPFTLYGKKLHPSRFMFICVLGWGVAASAQAGGYNFAGIAAARFFVGLFEAGFAPTAIYYFTLWYTREEVAFRTAIYVGMAALSGAFGGLIAYAVTLINTNFGHWRILFLAEGIPSVICAFFALAFLPDRPETSKFFKNEAERKLAIERMNRGQQSEGHGVLVTKHVIAAFKDWTIYALALIKMGHDAALAAISVFLPTIIRSLGYTNQQAQYLTIGPYMVAWASLLSVCYFSDRLRMRGPFLFGCGLVSVLGLALLYTHPAHTNPKTALGGIFLLLAGVFPCLSLELQWATGNCGAESKKTAAVSIMVVAGHCWSILASHSFPDVEGPRYVRGYAIVLTFLSLGVVISAFLHFRYRRINAERDRLYGKPNPNEKVDTSELADKAPMFRYVV
ncbi:hypothetical protein ACJ72_00221 [Emergomyces africanus]|uniref:Major facilitator superfamily (MFS) profile domain-containing protein n=1 Tax=Emergomyces africanus TaxID=1955775 RepID=A0A1B7P8Q4_9EURO|nr:hypothetical protein ACJ72_00221 [Emergomyces africanus]